MYVERDITQYIVSQIRKQKIVILIGARQTGKTTLLKHIQKTFFPYNSLYMSLDNPDFMDSFASVSSLIDKLIIEGININKTSFIFLDEFQYMPSIIPIIKYITDNYDTIKFILSGSSSLMIFSQLKESLAGRKRVIISYPFSLFEIMYKDIENITKLNKKLEHNIKESSAYFKLQNLLIYGKMPKIYLEPNKREKIAELKEIYSSYLLKDVRHFIRGEEQININKLLKLLAFQIGNVVNYSSLAKNSGLTLYKTKEYIKILEQTYIIKIINSFSSNIRGEILKQPKIFFYDNGIRNVIINNFSPMNERDDMGKLFENFLFSELISLLSLYNLEDSLYYWRTKAKTEIDFVIKINSKIIPIEVKYNISKAKTIPALYNFMEHLNIKEGYVVSASFIGNHTYKNRIVHYKTIFDFIYYLNNILKQNKAENRFIAFD